MKEYKVIAEGDFNTIRSVIPAIAFISHQRDVKIRATIIIEEIDEKKK